MKRFSISVVLAMVVMMGSSAYAAELADVIAALKVVTGLSLNSTYADIDGNGKIELQDAILGLQMIAGLRGENPDIVFLASIDTDKLMLAWLPTSNDSTSTSEMKYEVHLSEQSNFQPSDTTRKSVVTGDAQAKIEGLKTGTIYYAVIVAVDKNGGKTKGRYHSSAKTFTNPLIQSNAAVNIDSNLGLNGAVQNGTQYIYPKTAGAISPAAGSILFGKVGQETYMRKVVSVTATADSIIIETADAELSQVFDQATVSTGTKLFNIGQVAAQSAQRSLRSDGSRHSVIRWKDDLLVAEQTDHAGETEDVSLSPGAGDNEYHIRVKRDSDSAGVEPKIEFTPSIDVNVDWQYDPLKKDIVINGAEVIARGTLSAELRAFYNFSSSGTVSKEIPFPVFTKTFTSLYNLGPVPVYQRTTFTLKATVIATASSKINAEAKAKTSASIEFGAMYNGSEWQQIPPSPSFEKSCTAKIEVQGGVTGEVRLIPDIQVEFYRVAALDASFEPFVSAEIEYETMAKADIIKSYGYLETQLTKFDVYLQAQAYVSASLGIFSKKASIFDKTKVWESEKWMLFSLPKIKVVGSNGKVSQPIQLTANITDGVNNPLNLGSVRWFVSPKKGTISSQTQTTTFTASEVGTYTLFFSGNSLLGDYAFGRQFAWTDITVEDDSPSGIPSQCIDIQDRCANADIPNRCIDVQDVCPTGTPSPKDQYGRLDGTSVTINNGVTNLKTYVHGVLSGPYGSWDAQCKLMFYGNYLNEKSDGISMVVSAGYSGGNLVRYYTLTTYVSGIEKGPVGSWTISDCKPVGGWYGSYDGFYDDYGPKKWSGVWKYLHKDVDYKMETYDKGVLNGYSGVWKTADCKPQMGSCHGNYVNGQKDGLWTCLSDNGDFFTNTTYTNGVKNGHSGSWQTADCKPTGEHGDYVNDKKDGIWTSFWTSFDSSQGYSKNTYSNGIKNGFSGNWKADGTPTGWHGNYVNGKQNGTWIYYCSDGKTTTTTTYANGVYVSSSGHCPN